MQSGQQCIDPHYPLLTTARCHLDLIPNPSKLQVLPSLDDTLVVMSTWDVPGARNRFSITLQHVWSPGVVIRELDLGVVASAHLDMLGDSLVLVEVRDGSGCYHHIHQWNLITNQVIKMQCGKGENTFYVFPITKQLCIVQKMPVGSKYLHSHFPIETSINYYQLPLTSTAPTPTYTLPASQLSMLGFWDIPHQINQEWGVAFRKGQPVHYYDFAQVDYNCTWLLDPTHQPPLRGYQHAHLGERLGPLKSYYVKDVWQFQKGVLYMRVVEFVSLRKAMEQTPDMNSQQVDKQENVQHWVWNYETGEMREAHFSKQIDESSEYCIQFFNQYRSCSSTCKNWYLVSPISEQMLTSLSITGSLSQTSSHTFLTHSPKNNQAQVQVQVVRVRELEVHWRIYLTFIIMELVQHCDDDLVEEMLVLMGEGISKREGKGKEKEERDNQGCDWQWVGLF